MRLRSLVPRWPLRRWLFENRHVLAVVGIAVLPFVVVWGQGHLFYDFDMTFITAPIEDMFARYERAGQLPLWAPEIQGGFPLIAISHLGFFYPPHALLRLLLPGVLTLNVSLFLHWILATVGAYLALRQDGFRKESSALGALVIGGTGFFVGHLYLTNVLLPLTWVFVSIWLLGFWLKHRSPLALLGLSVAIALQILLGQPQAALIGVVVLAIYAATHLLAAPRQTFLRLFPLLPAAALTLALAYAQIQPTLHLVPYSDRADALLEEELYEFSFPISHVISWVFPHAFGYGEQYFGAKNETEVASWFGVGILLIVGCGVLTLTRMRRHPRLFILALALVSLAMASGRFSPFYRYLVEQQWITSLAIPARWIFLLVIATAWTAAHGLETLLQAPVKEKKRLLALSVIAILALVSVAAFRLPSDLVSPVRAQLIRFPLRTIVPVGSGLLMILAILRILPRRVAPIFVLIAVELAIPNIVRNVHVPFTKVFHRAQAEDVLTTTEPQPRLFTQRQLTILPPPPRVKFAPLKRLEQNFSLEQTFLSVANNLQGVEILFSWPSNARVDGEVHVRVTDMHTQETREERIFASAVDDGEWTPVRFSPLRNIVGHPLRVTLTNTFAKPGPWIHFTGNADRADLLVGGSLLVCTNGTCTEPSITDIPPGRVDLALEPLTSPVNRIALAQELLSPHIAAGKGYASAQWLGALQLREMKRYLYAIGDQNENAPDHNPFLEKHRDMLDRLNVAYLLGAHEADEQLGPLQDVDLVQEHLWESHWVRLYRNRRAYPRIAFARQVISSNHADEVLGMLMSNKVPADTVIAQDDTQTKGVPLSVGDVTVLGYAPTEVVLKTANDGYGFLVLRDTFFPEWRADVDGTPVRIFPTDLIFRGVLVPPGEHTVRFEYRPIQTIRAVQISGAAWLVVSLLILGFWIIPSMRRVHDQARPFSWLRSFFSNGKM